MAALRRKSLQEVTRLVWWLPLLGLLVGLALGMVFSLTVPASYSRYTAMAILAALDSVLGATRAELGGEFDHRMFLTGLLSNIILASFLTLLGDRLGVDLYIAAVVAFGVRMFKNLAIIRRQLLERLAGAKRTQGAESD